MEPITVYQLASLLSKYDDNKGAYRNGVVTSWFVGADQTDIAKLKSFYADLINLEQKEDRNLYPIELFQLARIVVASKTAAGSLSATVFDELKAAYGSNVIAGLAVLNEHHAAYKIFTDDNFNKVVAAQDPVQAAKVIVALNILHASELSCEKVAELRAKIEAHAAPMRLAEGIKGVSTTGYKFNTDENLQKVLSSGDPLKTAQEIVYHEVAPGYDTTNPGYFPKLNLVYCLNWSSLFSTKGAAAGKKDHGVDNCQELQKVHAASPVITP